MQLLFFPGHRPARYMAHDMYFPATAYDAEEIDTVTKLIANSKQKRVSNQRNIK